MKIKIKKLFKNKKKSMVNTRRKSQKVLKNKNSDDSTVYRRRGAINLEKRKFYIINKEFVQKVLQNRSYYILFAFMVILAVVSIYTNIKTFSRINDESYQVFNNNDEETKELSSSISEVLQEESSNNIDTRKVINEDKINEELNINVNNEKIDEIENKIPVLEFIKPINGEIIKIYSMDKLLYSKTLEAWKTHNGIDIKADLGTSVKSVEKGIVDRIYNDSFLGNTIILDHGQGYKSIYSNLDSSINIKEGEVVDKNRVIGKVGKTAIGEIKDENHLHFMLMFNNEVIDPASEIKF